MSFQILPSYRQPGTLHHDRSRKQRSETEWKRGSLISQQRQWEWCGSKREKLNEILREERGWQRTPSLGHSSQSQVPRWTRRREHYPKANRHLSGTRHALFQPQRRNNPCRGAFNRERGVDQRRRKGRRPQGQSSHFDPMRMNPIGRPDRALVVFPQRKEGSRLKSRE